MGSGRQMYGRRDRSVREAGGWDPQSPPSILTKWMTQCSSPQRKRRHQIQAWLPRKWKGLSLQLCTLFNFCTTIVSKEAQGFLSFKHRRQLILKSHKLLTLLRWAVLVFISLKRFSRFSWKGFSAAETWLPCTLIPSSKISTYVSWKSKYNYSIKYNSILSKILTSSFHFNFQVVNAYFRSILKVIKQFNPCLTLSLLHFNAPFPLKFQASVLRLEPHVFWKIPESLRPFTRWPKSSRTLGAILSRFAQDPLDLVSFSKTLIEE